MLLGGFLAFRRVSAFLSGPKRYTFVSIVLARVQGIIAGLSLLVRQKVNYVRSHLFGLTVGFFRIPVAEMPALGKHTTGDNAPGSVLGICGYARSVCGETEGDGIDTEFQSPVQVPSERVDCGPNCGPTWTGTGTGNSEPGTGNLLSGGAMVSVRDRRDKSTSPSRKSAAGGRMSFRARRVGNTSSPRSSLKRCLRVFWPRRPARLVT